MAGAALDGADVVVKRGEVNPLGEFPDEARLVILVQEVLQGHGREELLAIAAAQARLGFGRRGRLDRGRGIAHRSVLGGAA